MVVPVGGLVLRLALGAVPGAALCLQLGRVAGLHVCLALSVTHLKLFQVHCIWGNVVNTFLIIISDFLNAAAEVD